MGNNEASIDIECRSCSGTGVYRGMAEPAGVAVVCLNCQGTGKAQLKYVPFTARKRRDGVQTVRLSAGTMIFAGCGPRGGSVSYEEFLRGGMPKP